MYVISSNLALLMRKITHLPQRKDGVSVLPVCVVLKYNQAYMYVLFNESCFDELIAAVYLSNRIFYFLQNCLRCVAAKEVV